MGSFFEGPQIATPKSVSGLTANNVADLQPLNLNAGGLRSSLKGGTLNLKSRGQRRGLIEGLSQTSLAQAGELAGLRGQVGDAVGGLRASRLREVENARRASVSNLRDNLARRRVLGSSFGQDAETRANLEFAQEADRVESESFLQEIELSNQLINQEFDARRLAFQTKIDDLNFQAEVGAALTNQASSVLQASAQLKSQLALQRARIEAQFGLSQAELDAQAQAGAGALIGKLAGVGLAPFTGGASLALAT